MPVTGAIPALAMEVDPSLETTMGPGRAAVDDRLPPEIFADQTGDEGWAMEQVLPDYEEEEDEQERIVIQPAARFFQNPLDPVDEGDFDEDREQKLIVSLTRHHEHPVSPSEVAFPK